ncbi:MAG: IS200/IS605 family transposase [Deltaproteobacteria bacterium]|nr:IS200/IS605 family transposase [Deltaproteobacteria bacterium]MBI4374754.1 IS200/IS605 family transposase [Deltaproteobacteria bacterium]
MEPTLTHTCHRLYFHLIWTTKNRELLISTDVEKALYPFLLQKTRELGAQLLALNGTDDHLHFLVKLPPKMAPAKFVKDIKGSSSHFLSQKSGLNVVFKWQAGYGIFSVGTKEIPFIRAYIQKQKEHHKSGKVIGEFETTE